jgi:hypothetical protein
MKKVFMVPALAAALFAAACGGDSPTEVDTRPRVRFFNATTGMTGSGGFTTNGQFAAGSALGFGQAAQTCARIDAGPTLFAFGAANSGGAGLSGNALATLSNQSLAAGGNYTVVAAGSVTSPTLFMLDNSFPGTLATNQAAVRFVNLAPGTEAAPKNYAAFIGTFNAGGTLHANNPAFAAPTTFTTVASGANSFSVLRNHELPATDLTLNLQGGTTSTIAIAPSAGAFQLINLPSCA